MRKAVILMRGKKYNLCCDVEFLEEFTKYVLMDARHTNEVKLIFQYIENFDRDCKYILKKPASVPVFILEVLRSYVEFANINKNFCF